MGVTVREKPKGSGVWWIFVNDRGQRQSRRIGSKSAAVRVQKEIEAELAREAFRIGRKDIPTFHEYAENWLESVAKLSLKNSTQRSYANLLRNNVYPAIGSKPLDAITSKDVSDLVLATIKKGLRSSTAKNMKNCISAVFRHAIIPDGLIKVNPARGVPVPKPEGETAKREADPLTWKERDILERTFREHFPYYHPLVVLGTRTGLRIGELLALQWGDIDFIQRLILVQRNITHGKLTTPKSRAGRRMVRLTTNAVEALERHRKVMIERTLKRGWKELPEWVFTGEDGNPINYGNFIHRVWNKAMMKSKLRRRTPHDLRHTYATLRLSNGDSLTEVSKEMGHGSPDITYRTYYKWLPKESRTDIDALDNPCTHPHPGRTQTL